MKPILELQNVSKIYKQAEIETMGVDNLSLKVFSGDFIAITGRSGCGKSTLLNIIGGMDELTDGTYYFEGEDVSHMNPKQAAQFRAKRVGYVFQSFNLINEISALQNVCMPLGYSGVGRHKRENIGRKMLQLVNLEDKADKRPIHLSGGEQQRVAIARALALEPAVLLADEPTGNLDEENSQIIMELFSQLNKKKVTILMVTHSLEIAAWAGKQVHMRNGRIVYNKSLDILEESN